MDDIAIESSKNEEFGASERPLKRRRLSYTESSQQSNAEENLLLTNMTCRPTMVFNRKPAIMIMKVLGQWLQSQNT